MIVSTHVDLCRTQDFTDIHNNSDLKIYSLHFLDSTSSVGSLVVIRGIHICVDRSTLARTCQHQFSVLLEKHAFLHTRRNSFIFFKSKCNVM